MGFSVFGAIGQHRNLPDCCQSQESRETLSQQALPFCLSLKVYHLLETIFQLIFALTETCRCRQRGIGDGSKAQDCLTIGNSFFFTGHLIHNIPIAVGFPIPTNLPKGEPYKRVAPKEDLYNAKQVIGHCVSVLDVCQFMEQYMIQLGFRQSVNAAFWKNHE